jgi:signal transduction histidine kinase
MLREIVIEESCTAYDAYTASLTSLQKGSIILINDDNQSLLGVVKASVIKNNICINKVLISKDFMKQQYKTGYSG